MPEDFESVIAKLSQEITEAERKLSDDKRLVNMLCVKAGRPTLYSEAERPSEMGLGSIQRDQWYGQPISTAIREYLSMRRNARLGPATVNEIFDALTNGGYAFEAKDAENAKRGIRICLTKNTLIFHRLPDGAHYGLLDWYPEQKARKEREPTAAPSPTPAATPNGDAAKAPESRKTLDEGSGKEEAISAKA